MEMPSRATLDWIEGSTDDFTEDENLLAKLASRITGLDASAWYSDKAFNRYKLCVRHKSGVQCLSGTRGNGLHIIASGQAITDLAEHGISQMAFIGVLAEHGVKPTRYDLALDCTNMAINPSALHKQFLAGHAESKARTPYLIRSGQEGLTLYVGAQQSDRHLRMYNKSAEIKNKAHVPEGVRDWIRIELVMMREFARYAHDSITDSGIDIATRSHIKEFVNFPADRRFNRAIAGPIMPIGKSIRKITDTQAWLLSVVARTVAKQSIADPEFLGTFLGRLNADLDELKQ
jgi:hypothetical protein